MKKYKVTYKKYNRPLFIFNCGSSQDARATLIGNTYFKKDTGTILCKSEFVEAIQTHNAIILLDELSRGHHDFWNILLPTIDPTQRTLRLDESENSAVIHVLPDVTFMATANVGNEYTSTKVMDKALTARFPTIIEMIPLEYEGEMELLKINHPDVLQDVLEGFISICRISDDTKKQCRLDNPRITTFIPTGTVVEMAEMLIDGFSLMDIAQSVIYPMYDDSGGAESERLYVKQIVQKYLDNKSGGVSSPINDPLNKVGTSGNKFSF